MGFFKGHFLGFYLELGKKSPKMRARKKKEEKQLQQEISYKHNAASKTHIPILSEMQQDEKKTGRNEDTEKGTLLEPDHCATIKSREIYLHPNDVSILQVVRC